MRGISRLAAKPVSFSRGTLLHAVSKLVVSLWPYGVLCRKGFVVDSNMNKNLEVREVLEICVIGGLLVIECCAGRNVAEFLH